MQSGYYEALPLWALFWLISAMFLLSGVSCLSACLFVAFDRRYFIVGVALTALAAPALVLALRSHLT